MEAEQSNNISKAYPMKAGNDHYSYDKNSSYQKGAIDAARSIINEAIPEMLEVQNLTMPNIIRVADMGCSIGPNTFSAVDNIIEAVRKKYKLHGKVLADQFPQFHVLFNDHVSNDFNTLFRSFPPNRTYYAAGVPGSFYSPLFPKSSLDIVHSSFALQWLSEVPKEVVNRSSSAWNKGRIFYSSEDDETTKAFKDQFSKDMDSFLHFRAQEVACGGLVIIVVPGRLNGTLHSQVSSNITYNVLGSCLVDMAEEGIITEEKVNSFNIPIYLPCPQDFEAAMERNGRFSIERLECLAIEKTQDNSLAKASIISSHMRAGMEVLLKSHFGSEIMDHLFESFRKKLENPAVFQNGVAFILTVVLKSKET